MTLFGYQVFYRILIKSNTLLSAWQELIGHVVVLHSKMEDE